MKAELGNFLLPHTPTVFWPAPPSRGSKPPARNPSKPARQPVQPVKARPDAGRSVSPAIIFA